VRKTYHIKIEELLSKYSNSLNQTGYRVIEDSGSFYRDIDYRQWEKFDYGVASSGSVRLSWSSILFDIYSIGSELRVKFVVLFVLICSCLVNNWTMCCILTTSRVLSVLRLM